MSVVELRQDAVRLIDDALQKPPAELKAEVDDAERLVVGLRDALIERLRGGDASVRTALDNVNAALSLIVGIEYPLGGLQRSMLDQAHKALQQVQLT